MGLWRAATTLAVIGLTACVHRPVEQKLPIPVPPTVVASPPPAPEPHKHEDRWLPPGLGDRQLGLPMADVERLHTLSPADNLLDFRLDRTETLPDGPYSEITYYFDADLPGQPLYELIVVWRDTAARDAWAAGLGERQGNDWVFTEGAPWTVRAWAFADKYVVAASMPGTEWE